MQKANVVINDDNSPKKLSAFLEKLIAQSILEQIKTAPFEKTIQKVDSPHE